MNNEIIEAFLELLKLCVPLALVVAIYWYGIIPLLHYLGALDV